MSKTTEEKIDEMHDMMIRLEPICEQVKKHEKTLYNGGWGITAQVKVLWVIIPGIWAIFLIWFKSKI